jgi:hypothetical protein
MAIQALHEVQPWMWSQSQCLSNFRIQRLLTPCAADSRAFRAELVTRYPPPALQVTTLVSYLSHSQVWALQDGATLHIGSRTNRATFQFGREMEAVLDAMPERPPSAPVLRDVSS